MYTHTRMNKVVGNIVKRYLVYTYKIIVELLSVMWRSKLVLHFISSRVNRTLRVDSPFRREFTSKVACMV